jgi:hypothetical protein
MMLALGVAGAACPHVAGVTLTYAGVAARLAGAPESPRRASERSRAPRVCRFALLRSGSRSVTVPKGAPDGAPRKKDLLIATFKGSVEGSDQLREPPRSRRVRIPLGASSTRRPGRKRMVGRDGRAGHAARARLVCHRCAIGTGPELPLASPAVEAYARRGSRLGVSAMAFGPPAAQRGGRPCVLEEREPAGGHARASSSGRFVPSCARFFCPEPGTPPRTASGPCRRRP